MFDLLNVTKESKITLLSSFYTMNDIEEILTLDISWVKPSVHQSQR